MNKQEKKPQVKDDSDSDDFEIEESGMTDGDDDSSLEFEANL